MLEWRLVDRAAGLQTPSHAGRTESPQTTAEEALPVGGMIWSLQTLRFFAALMVVYLHAAHFAGYSDVVPRWLIKTGGAGVDIFFVISGFVIARIAVGRTAAEFARARFYRIVP